MIVYVDVHRVMGCAAVSANLGAAVKMAPVVMIVAAVVVVLLHRPDAMHTSTNLTDGNR
jgi:hypothetical protein